MKLDKPKEILILFLAAILLCTACGKEKEEAPAAAKATTMSLMKTKGTVNIDDRDGKQIEPVKNLKLYSGYGMFTQKTSYAWINLDRVKLAKMDEKSEVKIQKDEKRLEIHVNSGSLFFHVKEPLQEDETMNIRNSTMAVGIRGTCGWTVRKNDRHSQVYILEGKVTIQAKDGKTAKVRAGQKADVTIDQNGKSKIVISKFTVKEIPEFVMKELRRDEDLAAEILDASGLDVLNSLPEEAAEETEAAPEETENAEEAEETNEPEETNEVEGSEQNEVNFEGDYGNNNEAYNFSVFITSNENGTYTALWSGQGIWAQSYEGRVENNALIVTLDDGEELTITKEGDLLTVTASDTYIRTYDENGWTRFDGTYTKTDWS